MSAAHTRGPWRLETVPTSCGVCHKVGPFPGKRDGDKPRHACLYSDYPTESNPSDMELLANARLIAAAPVLLDACQHATEWLEQWASAEPYLGRLYAAIAAATGAKP